MKKSIVSLTAITLLGLAACNQPAKTERPFTPKSWDYTITGKTTKHSLDSLCSLLKADSIDLKFSKAEYDSTGMLTKIAGTINFTGVGKTMSGMFSSDSVKQKPFEIKLSNQPSEYFGDKK
jgi:hypothetical protein